MLAAALLSAAFLLSANTPSRAESGELRLSQQFGVNYLPLMVLKEQRLVEQEAALRGIPGLKVSWAQFSGGGAMNDALLSGSLDIAAAGVAPAITIWSRTQRNLRVRALASLGAFPFYLVSRDPDVRSVRDLKAGDRIAVPAAGVSFQSVVLQMAAAQAFGPEEWKRLDALTVTLPHPDATAALLSGRSEITAHASGAPFQEQELQAPGVHRVFSSYEIVGGPHSTVLLYATQRFHDANPRLCEAFVAALEQADAYIAQHPAEAAALYLRAEPSRLSEAAIQAILVNPDFRFETTPRRVMDFAAFMARTGQIPVAPASWQDLFFPNPQAREGGS